MSKTAPETYDENVVVVTNPTELPYLHIPYSTFSGARELHPDTTLYIYEHIYGGGKIVAFPLLMKKPEEAVSGG